MKGRISVNENTEDILYYAMWITILVIALMIVSRDIEVQQSYQKSIQDLTSKDHRLYTTYGTIEEETYSGAEVLQSIQQIGEINADIQVEGFTFRKSIDIEEVDISMINLQKKYKVNYVRNTTGIITTIIFT